MRLALSLSFLAVALAPCIAQAQARPSLWTMTCAQAQAMVRQQGSVMMNYGPMTYDRFVASPTSCGMRGVVRPEYQPTRDNRQCFIGYTCNSNSGGGR